MPRYQVDTLNGRFVFDAVDEDQARRLGKDGGRIVTGVEEIVGGDVPKTTKKAKAAKKAKATKKAAAKKATTKAKVKAARKAPEKATKKALDVPDGSLVETPEKATPLPPFRQADSSGHGKIL